MTVTKPTLDNANPNLSAAQAPTSQPPRYRPLTIGIVAGEVSGDALGADLMRQMNNLRDDIIWVGVGGAKMQAQGLKSIFPL